MLTDELEMLQTFTDSLSEALHGSVAAKRQELLADMSAASKRPANRGSTRGSHEAAASNLLTPTPRSISTVAPFTPRAATAPDAAGAPANISSSSDTPRTHATPILRPRPASESSTSKGGGGVERLGGGAGAVGVGMGVPDAFVKATPPKIALELAAIPASKGVSAGGAAGRGAGGAERAQTHRPSSSGMRR
jgi:hypothetical protein